MANPRSCTSEKVAKLGGAWTEMPVSACLVSPSHRRSGALASNAFQWVGPWPARVKKKPWDRQPVGASVPAFTST